MIFSPGGIRQGGCKSMHRSDLFIRDIKLLKLEGGSVAKTTEI